MMLSLDWVWMAAGTDVLILHGAGIILRMHSNWTSTENWTSIPNSAGWSRAVALGRFMNRAPLLSRASSLNR